MASATYYREEAARCRTLAANAPQSAGAGRWRKLADEYEQLAQSFEASERRERASPPGPVIPPIFKLEFANE